MALEVESFNFAIFPVSEPSLQCVCHYNITPTSGDGNVLTDIIVEPTGGGRPLTVNASGFDLCRTTYSFTVVAVTLNGPGDRSGDIYPETLDFLSKYGVVSFVFTLYLTQWVIYKAN